MQLWVARSCGVLGIGRRLKYEGRSHDGHAEIGTDTDSDHVLRDLLAQPYAGIDFLCNDVRQSIIDDDLDADLGIARQDFSERRLQYGHCCVLTGGNANRAGRFFSQLAQRDERCFYFFKP